MELEWNGDCFCSMQIWNHPDIYYTEAMAQDSRRVSPVSDSLVLVTTVPPLELLFYSPDFVAG